jgi:hypothetical protein
LNADIKSMPGGCRQIQRFARRVRARPGCGDPCFASTTTPTGVTKSEPLASSGRTWLTMSDFLSRLPRGYIRHLERMVYQPYLRALARRIAESALDEAVLLMDLGLS